MTFDEWWKVMKPAEFDELKEYFIEAYQLGFNNGCARLNDPLRPTIPDRQARHSPITSKARW